MNNEINITLTSDENINNIKFPGMEIKKLSSFFKKINDKNKNDIIINNGFDVFIWKNLISFPWIKDFDIENAYCNNNYICLSFKKDNYVIDVFFNSRTVYVYKKQICDLGAYGGEIIICSQSFEESYTTILSKDVEITFNDINIDIFSNILNLSPKINLVMENKYVLGKYYHNITTYSGLLVNINKIALTSRDVNKQKMIDDLYINILRNMVEEIKICDTGDGSEIVVP